MIVFTGNKVRCTSGRCQHLDVLLAFDVRRTCAELLQQQVIHRHTAVGESFQMVPVETLHNCHIEVHNCDSIVGLAPRQAVVLEQSHGDLRVVVGVVSTNLWHIAPSQTPLSSTLRQRLNVLLKILIQIA